MKLSETSIPVNYSELLKREGYDVPAVFAEELIPSVLFEAVQVFINSIRVKGKSALVLKDYNNVFLFAVISNYVPGTEEGQGHYTLDCSFDEDKIADAKCYDFSDSTFLGVVRAISERENMDFLDNTMIKLTYQYFLKALVDWLSVNSGEVEHAKFTAKAADEDGLHFMAIVLPGEVVQTVKNDAAESM